MVNAASGPLLRMVRHFQPGAGRVAEVGFGKFSLAGAEVFHDPEPDANSDSDPQAAQEQGQAQGIFGLGDVG